ncbi:MAG TPA: gfo/Idh/MocA family oxidoreductase, partial [Clostridiales bacterium]|nr:gfo/Idh/MocA family oxidoreductase [Clostridiales bacterium]
MSHRLGIIGYGGMATWHHKNSGRVEGLTCTAAYDISPERLKVARESGLDTYSTLDSFLENGDFDIVLVATPNNFHKELAVAAMNSGRHVVCEKPVAMSSAELQEMMDAAEKNRVIFTVHQNRRWDKDFLIVKKAIEDGLIGKPYTIESRVHGARGVIHGWRAYKVAGGGMILDWGVHLLDQIMFMIRERVVNVFARLHSIKTPEVDDYFKVILTFESGINAQVEVGTFCLKSLPRWYVNGDQGSIYINGWNADGGIIRTRDSVMEWQEEIVQTAAGPTRTMAPR